VRVQKKTGQSFLPFLRVLAGDAGQPHHHGWLFPPAPAFACAAPQKAPIHLVGPSHMAQSKTLAMIRFPVNQADALQQILA